MKVFDSLVLVCILSEVSSADLIDNTVLKDIRHSIESYRQQAISTEKTVRLSLLRQKQIVHNIEILSVFKNQCGYNKPCLVLNFNDFWKNIITNMNFFEIPLEERVSELEERIEEVKTLIDIQYQQFNATLQRCVKDDIVCSMKVVKEFESSLKIISCQIERNCSIEGASNRSSGLSDIVKPSSDQVRNELKDYEYGSNKMSYSPTGEFFTAENCSLEYGYFLCNKGKCVTVGELCDGKDNCGDGSDEEGYCGELNCGPGCYSAGGVCFGSPRGGICLAQCPPGASPTPGGGCIPGPKPELPSIQELLEEIPELFKRYCSALRTIRTQFFRLISRKAYENIDYGRGEDSSLRKLMGLNRFDGFVSNLSSTTVRNETEK